MLTPPILESQSARDLYERGYLVDLQDRCGQSFNAFGQAVCERNGSGTPKITSDNLCANPAAMLPCTTSSWFANRCSRATKYTKAQ